MENITVAKGESAGAIVGLPEAPIVRVATHNVKISAHRGLTIGYADVSGARLMVHAEEGQEITTLEGANVSIR
jgi:hypothetical protein